MDSDKASWIVIEKTLEGKQQTTKQRLVKSKIENNKLFDLIILIVQDKTLIKVSTENYKNLKQLLGISIK